MEVVPMSARVCLPLSRWGTGDSHWQKEGLSCWTSHLGSRSLWWPAPSLSSAGQSWGKR